MTRATETELSRWRELEACDVMKALAEHAKQDPTFTPLKDQRTSRWHVSAGGRDYELLVTGPKFFDTRKSKGGGGALDLTMHILGADFASAVKVLRSAGL